MSRSLSFSSSVDLSVIASSTENYSGADLQSILTTAQLQLIHEQLEQEQQQQSINGKSSQPLSHPVDSIPQLCQHHLLSALSSSSPSLTLSDRHNYDRIYEKFIASKGERVQDQTFDANKPQRTAQA